MPNQARYDGFGTFYDTIKVRTAKPRKNPYKLFDGGGLFLLVTPSGGKLWNFKYYFDNKEKKLTLRPYPEDPLLDARQRRDEARRQISRNIDPGEVRKAQKQAKTEETGTFEIIAREWYTEFTQTWTLGHATTIMNRSWRSSPTRIFLHPQSLPGRGVLQRSGPPGPMPCVLIFASRFR
ncbi:MAG: integrase arm-type DNA-binding domain-containing protein [Deltaproteobacteria bacterium]|nr:integrase arm-type DNA-binding domain-containing protein [Deltaproteobacteria bacterium]